MERLMKYRLFFIVSFCFFLMACSTGGVQRFEDYRNPDTSTLAVINERDSDSLWVNEFETTFSDFGFQVKKFVPFDKSLDYLVVYKLSDNIEVGMGKLFNVVIVDYKSRKIVARTVYKATGDVQQRVALEIVDAMLNSSRSTPDIITDLN